MTILLNPLSLVLSHLVLCPLSLNQTLFFRYALYGYTLYILYTLMQKSTEIPPLKGEPLTCIHTLSAASNFLPSQNSRLYKPVSWHWQGAHWQGLQIRAMVSHKFEISSRNIRQRRIFSLTL